MLIRSAAETQITLTKVAETLRICRFGKEISGPFLLRIFTNISIYLKQTQTGKFW